MAKCPKCDCGASIGLLPRDGRWWCADCVWAKMDGLQAIVDKLVKNASGDAVCLGDEQFAWHRDRVIPFTVTYVQQASRGEKRWGIAWGEGHRESVCLHHCYSTDEEAAIAAAEPEAA